MTEQEIYAVGKIFGNDDLIAFYHRPDVIEILKGIRPFHQTATTRARSLPRKHTVRKKITGMPFTFE